MIGSYDYKHIQTLFTIAQQAFVGFSWRWEHDDAVVEAGALIFLHMPRYTIASGVSRRSRRQSRNTVGTNRSTGTMATVLTNMSRFTSMSLGEMRGSFAETSTT